MPKFKIGDRVELLEHAIDNDHLRAGVKGSILEEDGFPFVQWDDFTHGHDNGNPSIPCSSWGVKESNLKRIKKPTTPKTKETKTMNTKKPGTSHGKPTSKGMKEDLKPKAKATPKPKYPAPREALTYGVTVTGKSTKESIKGLLDLTIEIHNGTLNDLATTGTKLDRALVDLKEAKAKIKELSKALEATK